MPGWTQYSNMTERADFFYVRKGKTEVFERSWSERLQEVPKEKSAASLPAASAPGLVAASKASAPGLAAASEASVLAAEQVLAAPKPKAKSHGKRAIGKADEDKAGSSKKKKCGAEPDEEPNKGGKPPRKEKTEATPLKEKRRRI